MQGRRKQQHAHGRGPTADASSVSLQTIIRQARKSGQLNLSNRSLNEGFRLEFSLLIAVYSSFKVAFVVIFRRSFGLYLGGV